MPGQTWSILSILTAHVQLVNSKVLRMDVVDLGRNVDRMLLPVTAAIYQNGVEKPAMRWTFEVAIGAISDQKLHGFLQRLRGGFGIAERCSELTIRKFKVSLSTKDFKVTPEFPKGRLFEIDCEEQWQTALKYLVNREQELIVFLKSMMPMIGHLSNLQTFAVTFGLHQKKQMSTSFTIDTAIARIQEVYDFDCQCIDRVKAFLGTEAQTKGPQGTVSSVVVENERRILLALGEIRDLFPKYAPQLLDVFKLKSLLTLVVENFFSEMRAGASDMPMQLQFDFRFSRAMKEHLKQMCTTRFSYYTSATSHYPRVKSDLKYSALSKMSPPSTAQLTKQQVQQMRDWRMKYSQSVPQKTVRNTSTKDNPDTLPINLYAQVQPTITPLDFSKIAEDGQDGARTTAHHDNSHELLYTSGDVVFLASEATSGRTVVYVLEESITASTKKAKARLFEGDPFNPPIFYTEGVVEINVKDIGGSLEETVRGDGNIELTENEFIRYQSRMIECVDAVTIEEAREISEGLDTDQDHAEDAWPRRASRARKRPHTDDFLYYDD